MKEKIKWFLISTSVCFVLLYLGYGLGVSREKNKVVISDYANSTETIEMPVNGTVRMTVVGNDTFRIEIVGLTMPEREWSK